MRSYLQGIRPSSRRSAIPPREPDTRQAGLDERKQAELANILTEDLSEPAAYRSQPGSSHGSPIDVPTESPPRPKTRGRVEKDGIIQLSATQTHWSFTGQAGQSSGNGVEAAEASRFTRFRPVSSHAQVANGPSFEPQVGQVIPEGAPTNANTTPSSSSSKPKRPIDLRFEQMRSYSEQPFRQSVYKEQEHVHGIQQPYAPSIAPSRYTSTYADDRTLQLQKSKSREQLNSITSIKSSEHTMTQNRPAADTPQTQTHAAQQRSSKGRLHMLRPINILARRRSHQVENSAFAESHKTPAPQIPADFDPSIRGKVIHDFSAPRISRPHTTGRESKAVEPTPEPFKPAELPRPLESPSGSDQEHAPVFKEHFDDGIEKSQDPSKRSSAFLQQMAAQASQPLPDPSKLPTFARKYTPDHERADRVEAGSDDPPLEVLSETPEQAPKPSLSPSAISPPRMPSNATSISDGISQGALSPKRYKSNASRFSFDLAGVGSAAQEKLLEDKHRQKTQQKQRQSTAVSDLLDDDDQYQDMEDLEGEMYEERIPGVNCDDDEDEGSSMPVLRRDMENFTFVSPGKSSFESNASPVSTGMTSVDLPRDFSGQQSGILPPKPAMIGLLPMNGATPDAVDPNRTPPQMIPTMPDDTQLPQDQASNALDKAHHPPVINFNDDDIYFDDGVIDAVSATSDASFDEDVFDDTSHGLYGLPLRDRALRPLENFEPQEEREVANTSDDDEDEQRPEPVDEQPETSIPGSAGLGLVGGDALTQAISQAAADGAFERRSISDFPNDTMEPEASVLGMDMHPPNDHTSRVDDLSDDDDAMVAAANAEALENDDEGFYGREFGFYARTSGSDKSEYMNGGYFGPHSLEDLQRSTSGKANIPEPSLTPITERSEWSNRNSSIFLPSMAVAPAQFADFPLDNVGAELAKLRQLRRGTFGGSDASMQSMQSGSNSPVNGSPVGPSQNRSSIQSSGSAVNLQGMSSSFNSFSSLGSNGRPVSLADSTQSDASPTVSINQSDQPTTQLPSSNSQAPVLKAPTRPPPAPPIDSTSHDTSRSTETKLPMAPPPIPSHAPPPTPSSQSSASVPQRSQTIQSHTHTRSISGTTKKPASAQRLSLSQQQQGHSRHSSAGSESISYKQERHSGKWVLETRRRISTEDAGHDVDGVDNVVIGRTVLDAGSI